MPPPLHDPRHDQTRAGLRNLGIFLLLGGLGFTAVGIGSFFSSFNAGPLDFEGPRYFWCAFVGLPMLAVGLALTKAGYWGTITRYIAGETAPVAKDTFNYLAEGTKDGVRTSAQAVGQGLAHGMGGAAVLRCPACETENAVSARFCTQCGTALARVCPACQKVNGPAAKFCDACGVKLPDGGGA
jgi:hypothetical protein